MLSLFVRNEKDDFIASVTLQNIVDCIAGSDTRLIVTKYTKDAAIVKYNGDNIFRLTAVSGYERKLLGIYHSIQSSSCWESKRNLTNFVVSDFGTYLISRSKAGMVVYANGSKTMYILPRIDASSSSLMCVLSEHLISLSSSSGAAATLMTDKNKNTLYPTTSTEEIVLSATSIVKRPAETSSMAQPAKVLKPTGLLSRLMSQVLRVVIASHEFSLLMRHVLRVSIRMFSCCNSSDRCFESAAGSCGQAVFNATASSGDS
jgi:hypothetical protein